MRRSVSFLVFYFDWCQGNVFGDLLAFLLV